MPAGNASPDNARRRPITHARAAALMVAASVLWSTAGVVTRVLERAQGFEAAFWRSFFAAVAWRGFSRGTGGAKPGGRACRRRSRGPVRTDVLHDVHVLHAGADADDRRQYARRQQPLSRVRGDPGLAGPRIAPARPLVDRHRGRRWRHGMDVLLRARPGVVRDADRLRGSGRGGGQRHHAAQVGKGGRPRAGGPAGRSLLGAGDPAFRAALPGDRAGPRMARRARHVSAGASLHAPGGRRAESSRPRRSPCSRCWRRFSVPCGRGWASARRPASATLVGGGVVLLAIAGNELVSLYGPARFRRVRSA